MISEVVPRGKEVRRFFSSRIHTDIQFLFFALFSLMGKASSFIGPFVSSAIIERSGNSNMPFTFLLGLGVFAVAILFCVDVDKSRLECRAYLEEEASRVYEMPSGINAVPSAVESVEGQEPMSHHADVKNR
jgi:hypothetical protein